MPGLRDAEMNGADQQKEQGREAFRRKETRQQDTNIGSSGLVCQSLVCSGGKKKKRMRRLDSELG